MSFLVTSPLPIFEDVDGQPLENGMIYIGTLNLNPQSNPVAVYWDAALTQPAAQPIRTSGGFPARSGTPARVYTASSYSIMVTNSKGKLVFSELSAGGSSLVSGMFSGIITDLNFDPTLLGMVDGEVRLLVTNSSPSNKPAGADTGTYYLITLAKVSSSEYRIQMTQSGAMGSIMTRYYSSGLWSDWNANGQSPLSLTTGSSPYTLVAGTVPTIKVNATTNPFIINLPDITGANGYMFTIVNTSVVATGLVKIVPFAGQRVSVLPANVACYLQNVEQSAYYKGERHITLLGDSSQNTWVVMDGNFMPEPGSVDTAGSQYYLGPLIRLPTGNNTSRGSTIPTPGAGTWSAAIQITGLYGVPIGAVAVRILITSSPTSVAAGQTSTTFLASDNTSFTTGPQSVISLSGVATAGGQTTSVGQGEFDVPLDSSGRFYIFQGGVTNLNAGSVAYNVKGYYMGV